MAETHHEECFSMLCISATRIATIGLVGTALVLGACSSRELIVECEDAAGLQVVCGLQNPEDLALLSDGRTLIVSQYGSMSDDRPGSIALLDLETEAVRVVHPIDGNGPALEPTPGWGDPECPGPAGAAFNPHGIDLAHRPDGRLQLLVVNHGGRESIEVFEVDESTSPAAVHWRGCVVAGYELYINDVVHVPEGGFLVTHMMDRESPNWDLLRASMGLDTGRVYSWRPVRGFEPVPGTDAPFPNGIELSPDGRTIYLNVYLPGEVRSIDREKGEVLRGAKVPSPDNSSWGRDGRLLVASHRGGFSDMRLCIDIEAGACPMPFAILALDPETLEAETLFEHEGAPMGGGTVAIDTGSELLIGSFAADRLLRVPHPVR